ncbi:MAG: BREX system ATP-binding domain-containing protein [Myxococcota bacterium]
MARDPSEGPPDANVVYVFEGAQLHTALCQLRVGDKAVPIEPRIYDLLRVLIEHRHRVLAKDELLAAIWPNVTVNIGVLKRAIWVLRQVLRTAGIPDPITTVPRRGYRFTAEVSVSPATPEGPVPKPRPDPIADADEPAPARPVDAPPAHLLGRAPQWSQILEALDRVAEGHGRLLLIRGEPGVGKTFLADAAGHEARRRGAGVLVAHGYEGEGAPALWMWIQILREYVDACDDPERLRAELGTGAGVVARLVPELRERVPSVSPSEPLSADDGRFPVLDALARFLRRASNRRPLVVLLDDLQWADRTSLELLELLSRQIASSALLIIATIRNQILPPEHWLTRLLGAVAHSADCTWLSLSGLDRADVARILEGPLGDSVRPELVDAVLAKTNGNPFFVQEIARLLGKESHGDPNRAGAGPGAGAGTGAGTSSFGVPERLRDAILRRVTALPAAAQEVLTAASVLGHVADARILQAILEHPGPAVLDALDAAVSARLLDDLGQGRMRFAHALVHEVLYDTLTHAERARLHAAAARALERLTAEDHVDEIARHYHEALGSGVWAEALRWARAAGAAAMERLGFEKAEAQYRRALEIARAHEPDNEVLAAELLIALGGAQRALSAPASVVKASYLEAAELARRGGSTPAFVEAALGYTGHGEYVDPYARYEPTIDPLRVELLERSAATVTAGSELEFQVLCRLAQELDGRQQPRREALVERAMAMATAQGLPRWQVLALVARCVVLGDQAERWTERIKASQRALALAQSLGDVRLQLSAHNLLAAEALSGGDWSGAEVHSRAVKVLVDRSRQPFATAATLGYEGMLAMLQGRFSEAYALNEQFTAAVGDGFVGGLEFAHGQLLKTRLLDGTIEQMSPQQVTAQLRGVRTSSTVWSAGFTYWLVRKGMLDAARPQFEALVDIDGDRLEPNGGRPSSLAYLADVAVALHDIDRARVIYRELQPFAGRLMVVSTVYCDGAAARPLGRLAALLGHQTATYAYFERALELHRRVHAEPFTALTLLQFSEALDRLGRDPERAREMASRAREQAQQLGMVLPNATRPAE